jgi:hypothetical protein
MQRDSGQQNGQCQHCQLVNIKVLRTVAFVKEKDFKKKAQSRRKKRETKRNQPVNPNRWVIYPGTPDQLKA